MELGVNKRKLLIKKNPSFPQRTTDIGQVIEFLAFQGREVKESPPWCDGEQWGTKTMGFVQGHPEIKFPFAALLYSCGCLSLPKPWQGACQASPPSTVAVTQSLLPQRALPDYWLQWTEKKTNSERLNDLPKVTELKKKKWQTTSSVTLWLSSHHTGFPCHPWKTREPCKSPSSRKSHACKAKF